LVDAETLVAGNPQKLQIKRVTQEVLAKDKLLPAQETTVFEFVPHSPEKPISGKVISAYGAEGISNSGRYQTVVINRGAQDGLEPGHVLAVYRTGKLVKMDEKKGGRQRWVFLDSGCIKPGEKISFDQPYEPGKAMQDCPGTEVQAGPWAYMDVGCLKPGKKVSFDQFFDPKEVYDRSCVDKTQADAVQLPDSRTGLVMVYRVFDRVSYALIMQSERPFTSRTRDKSPDPRVLAGESGRGDAGCALARPRFGTSCSRRRLRSPSHWHAHTAGGDLPPPMRCVRQNPTRQLDAAQPGSAARNSLMTWAERKPEGC